MPEERSSERWLPSLERILSAIRESNGEDALRQIIARELENAFTLGSQIGSRLLTD